MKTMYCARFSTNDISAVEVELDMGVSIRVVNGKLQPKSTENFTHCDTWQQAVDALVKYWTDEAIWAEEKAAYYHKQASEARALAKVQP